MLPCATVLLHCLRRINVTAPLQQPRCQLPCIQVASGEALLGPQCPVLRARGHTGILASELCLFLCSLAPGLKASLHVQQRG